MTVNAGDRVTLWLRQVHSAVSLSREASGRLLVELVPGEEALALQEADSGVVRLRSGDPFSEEMSALWLGVQSLGFVLVCEPHENLLLAEGTLRNLTRHCLEHLHMLGPGSEVRTPQKKYCFIVGTVAIQDAMSALEAKESD